MNRKFRAVARHYNSSHIGQDIASLAAGIGLGAGLMYLCDPDRGRSRRSRLIGEASGLLHRGENAVAKCGKDVANRVRGFAAKAAAESAPEQPVDDVVLVERVKSRMGHVLPHSHDVQIQVRDGVVTLDGKLEPDERRRAIEEVRTISGVKRVNGEARSRSVFRPGFLIGFAGLAGKAGPANTPRSN